MTVFDKNGVLDRIGGRTTVELELGCGNRKRNNSAIGIDRINYDCVDIIGEVNEVLERFSDHSVDSVFCYHFLEHVENLDFIMEEIARILKFGGLLEVVTPHFSNPYYYSDPTHRRYFGLYTMSYYALDMILKRKVPLYGKEPKFCLVDVNLIFKSAPPFYGRHLFHRVFGLLFNANGYLKELYEENFCYLLPCYEISYKLKRLE